MKYFFVNRIGCEFHFNREKNRKITILDKKEIGVYNGMTVS